MRILVWLIVLELGLMFIAAVVRTAVTQAQDVPSPVRAYTTADPVNADRFGLAVPDGRYMVQLTGTCGSVAIGQNVWVWRDTPDAWRVQPLESAEQCAVLVFGRMDDAPCFTDADGLCDVALDPPYPEGY